MIQRWQCSIILALVLSLCTIFVFVFAWWMVPSEAPPSCASRNITWCKGLRFKPPGPVVALASQPGSGNTWLRYLLQQTTGIKTGSKYMDFGLRANGFPAENITDGTVLVVKTHGIHVRCSRCKFESCVLLIRNPRDTILAEYNRQHGGHLGTALKSKFNNESAWTQFVAQGVKRWEYLYWYWLSYFPGPILIVYYESLVSDTEPSLRRILNFLNQTVSKDDMSCALTNREGKYRRNHTLQDFDPFTDNMYHVIERAYVRIYDGVADYERRHNMTVQPRLESFMKQDFFYFFVGQQDLPVPVTLKSSNLSMSTRLKSGATTKYATLVMTRRWLFMLAATMVLLHFTVIVFILSPLHGARRTYYARYQRYSWRSGLNVEWCKDLRFQPPGPVVALASYPGSGNTWLRYLLQQATGIMTGSKYMDYGLRAHGFPAENITDGSVLVVKTHDPPDFRAPYNYQAAVLLIRNPKDAILAEYNRLHKGHIGTAPKSAFKRKTYEHKTTPDWTKFVSYQLSGWENLHKFWLTRFPGRVLLVFYETLVRDTGASLQRILDFLNKTVTKDDMSCALANREGIYRRRHKLQDFDPFTADMYHAIEKVKERVHDYIADYNRRNNLTVQISRENIAPIK